MRHAGASRTESQVVAVLTVSRVKTMIRANHVYDFASALFVDSTRGVPEAGYWRVPAGTVTVTGAGRSLVLTATPDIENGLAYFASEDSFHYVSGARYTIQATGSDTVGAFRAAVVAPDAPHLTAPAMNDTVPRTRDLLVTWDPGPPGDTVSIELQPHSPSGYPHVTLNVPDIGRCVVPAASLDEFPSDYTTMVTLTRAHSTPVAARGIGSGRFTASASDYVHVHFSRRPPGR